MRLLSVQPFIFRVVCFLLYVINSTGIVRAKPENNIVLFKENIKTSSTRGWQRFAHTAHSIMAGKNLWVNIGGEKNVSG